MSHQIFKLIIDVGKKFGASRVDFVGDQYPDVCIKNAERNNRCKEPGQVAAILNTNQKVPNQWIKYLSAEESKERLLAFLSNHWATLAPESICGIEIYVANKELCFKLTPSLENIESAIVNDLQSNHDEADTRIALHCKQASLTSASILVRTPGTDVVTILTGLQSEINADFYVETGTVNRKRILDIKAAA